MARLYDAIEPEVVSMNMLQRAIESLRADGENHVIPQDEKINFGEVDVLRLDFRSKKLIFEFKFKKKPLCGFSKDILRMENLWLFTNLTKLQLDNNIIERIEGLDRLQKLTWLGKILK